MGITPITNLFPITVASSLKTSLEPLPMERAENSARTGDETYSPSDGGSAGGSQDDASEEDSLADDLDAEDGLGETVEEASSQSAAASGEDDTPGTVNFFA